jgi:ABC-type glycerol-3-phosphate transport system substrate-binding protein
VNRRTFLKLGTMAPVGVGLLSACASEPTAVPESAFETTTRATQMPPTMTASAPAESDIALSKIQLRPGYPLGGWSFGCGAFSALHAAFVKQHPDIGVNKAVCTYPFRSESVYAAIKSGDELDTFLWLGSAIEAARRGLAAPLDDLLALNPAVAPQDFHSALLDCNRFDGKLYGLPVGANVSSLMVNEPLFKENGLPLDRAQFPKSWRELRKLSSAYVRYDGDRLDRAVYVPDPITLQLNQLALCAGAGGIFDPVKKQFSLRSEALIELLAFFADWLKMDYKADARLLGVQSARFMRGTDAIDSGDMLWGTFYQYSSASVSAQQFKPMPMPTLAGTGSAVGASGLAYSIFPDSKNIEAAVTFIGAMASNPPRAYSFIGEMLPARMGVAELPVMTKLRSLRGAAVADDFVAFYKTQLAEAAPLTNHPLLDFVNQAAEPVLRQVMSGATAPKSGLEALEATLNAQLLK